MSQTGIGEGADPDNIAALCSDDVEFEIPGDDGALPGIGRKAGAARLPTSFVAYGV
jgi:ketosteroid isomerase-like protein